MYLGVTAEEECLQSHTRQGYRNRELAAK
jgi:hypothetical protein